MSKFWVIFKREYAQVVKKKSFIVGIILTPAIMAGFVLLPTLLIGKKATSAEKLAVVDRSEQGIGRQFEESLKRYKLEASGEPYYIVEQVFELPAADTVRFVAVEDSLRQVITDKELKYFLVLKPDAQLSDTNLYLVTNSDNFLSINRFEGRLSDILASIRLEESNVNLGVDSVLSLTRQVDLKIRDAKGESLPFLTKYMSALVFILVMFAMILGYGQMVMRSVIEEKNSRVMEVLVSSVTPFQLMLGKIIGLGAATFTQVAVWVLLGAGIYSMKGALNIDAAVDRIIFNPLIIVFFALFLTTGYLLYSTVFALLGSIVNSEKEAQNFIFPISMSLMFPVIIAMYIVQEPNSTLSIALSLVPFFAPTMMTMRLVFVAPTLTTYSVLSGIAAQAVLGFVIVVLTIVGMIWLTGKIFRVGILMYGKRPTLPEIVKWVKY
ncbi:MAG: ABC transporter permease [Candidatus Zixiibacteriota bacterium]|nr:MAG: ABC transporter permease [candidate division Zixibacteria bacterium]